MIFIFTLTSIFYEHLPRHIPGVRWCWRLDPTITRPQEPSSPNDTRDTTTSRNNDLALAIAHSSEYIRYSLETATTESVYCHPLKSPSKATPRTSPTGRLGQRPQPRGEPNRFKFKGEEKRGRADMQTAILPSYTPSTVPR